MRPRSKAGRAEARRPKKKKSTSRRPEKQVHPFESLRRSADRLSDAIDNFYQRTEEFHRQALEAGIRARAMTANLLAGHGIPPLRGQNIPKPRFRFNSRKQTQKQR